jgi:hypothetical protein
MSLTDFNAELQVKDQSAPSTADSFRSWVRKPTRKSSSVLPIPTSLIRQIGFHHSGPGPEEMARQTPAGGTERGFRRVYWY